MRLIVVIASAALLLALTLAWILIRTLSRLYDEVRSALGSREEVLAIVSHDLRNPLSSVMLSSDMMLKNAELPGAMRDKLARTIHSSAQQMKQLIGDLLDFVRLERGKLSVDPRTESAEAILSELHSVFLPLAREKDVTLQASVAPGTDKVFCDKLRIVQVLSNLLGNAIKFTPAGGQVRLHASSTGAEASDGEVVFWVKDTGPGVPEEQLERIFDRYWQNQAASREGVGLGLAIAKGWVEAHGGRIWAESLPGEGTTFFFTLPAPSVAPESMRVELSASSDSSARPLNTAT